MDTSASSTPRASTFALNQQVNTHAVGMRQSGRRAIVAWDVRIDLTREAIGPFSIMMVSGFRSAPSFVQSTRVLLSKKLRRSYIYEGYLESIGYTCTPMKVWKTTYHLGEFAPISMLPVYVSSGYEPVLVEFCVLRGAPPPEGVDFMIGEPTITAFFGPNWTPNSNWLSQQHV